MSNFEKEVIRLKVESIFSGSTFYITDLQELGDMLGIDPRQSRVYPYLQSLHCVKFSKMPDEVINNLQQKVIECFRPTFNTSALVFALTAEGSDFAPTEDRYLEKH